MKYKLIKEYPGSPKLNTILTHEELQYCNWNEYYQEVVEKDYEILEIKGKYGAISSFIEVLDSDLKDKVIFKIKRLSDGETFTIGDNTNHGKILNIYFGENITFHCDKDDEDPWLEDLKHIKKPLFTTEDGVDIFENGKYLFQVNIPSFTLFEKSLWNIHIHKEYLKYNKYFSTKEAAEEYILYNKPLLTLKDVEELLCKNTNSYFLEKFKKRAQKLNK